MGTGLTVPPQVGHPAAWFKVLESAILWLLAGDRSLLALVAVEPTLRRIALLGPTPGRAWHRSGRHPEARQHDPLQQCPGADNCQGHEEIAGAHYDPASIAARPRSISLLSSFTWRSSESQTVRQMANTVGSSMR